jgi:hypothetical protein
VNGGAEKGSTIKFTFLGDFNPDMLVTHLEEPNNRGLDLHRRSPELAGQHDVRHAERGPARALLHVRSRACATILGRAPTLSRDGG